MSDTLQVPGDTVPQPGRVRVSDLRAALVSGWRDFRRAPSFGIFFGAVYAIAGLGLIWLGAGTFVWTIAICLGFPLFAPFAAVGLYEVSRRIEQGDALDWYQVLGVIHAEKDRQMPWIGAIILIYVLFWSFLSHMIFALFMGLSVMTNVSTSYEVFLTPNGLTMMSVQFLVGGVLAFVLFALTVVSMPLLLDREVDFVSAMIVSFQLVVRNLPVMLLWAGFVAITTILAMIPVFLGLIVVLPILGHATWHLYRQALVPVE
ncbi:DUF2189 domain-containing protein [Aliiroseovarius sp. PTFE2010]|uniref:DUF2189 domain-containing protein n=1 Tax=Aliiroseovarius sp. PTFE2010 TaxID=3417190 RepID=UPI003CF9D1F7